MQYLKNDMCTFTPLFNIDYIVKKNIIVGCMFKMYNRGYRDFSVYVDGLRKVYNDIEKVRHMHDFTFRLFIDNSVYKDNEIMTKLRTMTKMEIVVYDCPMAHHKSNSDYHVGLFGTMIRFFPMFDFPNNDAKYIMITDIDSMIWFERKIELINKIDDKMNDIYVINSGNISKNVSMNYHLTYKNIPTLYTLANSFISIQRITSEPLLDYIHEVNNNDSGFYSTYSYKSDDEDYVKKIESTKPFIFGVDEYFINKNLIMYIIDNKIPFATNMKWSTFSPIYFYSTWTVDMSNDTQRKLHTLYDSIIKKFNLGNTNNMSLKINTCLLIETFTMIKQNITKK